MTDIHALAIDLAQKTDLEVDAFLARFDKIMARLTGTSGVPANSFSVVYGDITPDQMARIRAFMDTIASEEDTTNVFADALVYPEDITTAELKARFGAAIGPQVLPGTEIDLTEGVSYRYRAADKWELV